MKVDSKFRKKLKNLLDMQNGVLSTTDLWAIISPTSNVDFYRQIKKIKKEELISKVCRGFYIGEDFSVAHLVMAIKPDSYLSLEYALAYYNMIGTYSETKIRPILPRVIKDLRSKQVIIEFKKLKKELCFGYKVIDGIRMATPEKALLDTLYFYQKGIKFYFDIYSDIDCLEIDHQQIFKYLKKYQNPKFIKFVQDYLND